MTPLVLIGLRGAGKSAAGQGAAEGLGCAFWDTDQIIEARGQSIPELFSGGGEPAFRAVERAVIAELDPPPEVILATGGGAALDPDNRQRLAAIGRVVYLWAPPEVLAGRVAGSDRPPLSDADPLAELEQTLVVRDPIYRAFADRLLDTSSLSLGAVEERLVELASV